MRRERPYGETSSILERAGYCGPAVLQKVLREHGERCSQNGLAKDMGWTRNGVSPEAMFLRASKRHTCMASENMDLDTLAKFLPKSSVIVDWMSGLNEDTDGHYSILTKVSWNTITIFDPSEGREVVMDRRKFENVWWDKRTEGTLVYRWALIVK